MSPFVYDYETIHDEYWVPRLEQFLFKDLMNDIFKHKLFKESEEGLEESFAEKTSTMKTLYSYFVIL
jgi:hypothetical protein